jgi:hypothetical protein
MRGRRRGRDEGSRRKAEPAGAAGVLAAAALPVVLWHRVVAAIAGEFQLDLRYLVTGWSPWVLMAVGLVCAVPIWLADGRDRDRRFYRSPRRAWAGWGVTLYLLGFGLATQVAQIANGFSGA